MYAALLNTHKRGVALAIGPMSEQLDNFNHVSQCLLDLATQPSLPFPLAPEVSPARRYHAGDRIFAVSSGLTAENLSRLYSDSLGLIGISDDRIAAIGVAVGPGSFTGLRLGTAFANGLSLGRQRTLWAITSHTNASDVEHLKSQQGLILEEFWGEVSGDEQDPFAVPLSFVDLYLSLRQWGCGHAEVVERLEPRYGRDPTPVIKLRQQRNQSQ
jgi:hypothetical protein